MTDENQDDSERRLAFRLDMEKEIVDITWQNDTGQEQLKKIACLDFSRHGVKLDCDQAIPAETVVTVTFHPDQPESLQLIGKVIRCIKQENGWFEIALYFD